jgi:hypothetical protein
MWFTYSNTTFTSSTGVSVPRNTIISVRRNGIECDKLDDKFVYATGTTLTSLYAGTTFFPKYYIQAGVVYTHPASTTGAAGAVTYINLSSTAITSSVSASGLAISPVESPFLNYASGLDYTALSGFYVNKYEGDEDPS